MALNCKRPRQLTTGRRPFAKLVAIFFELSGQGHLQFSLMVVLTFSTLQAFKLATLGIVTQGPLQCIEY